MPVVSKAQFRLMQAAKNGQVDDVSPDLAREFLADAVSYRNLPARKRKASPAINAPKKKGKRP